MSKKTALALGFILLTLGCGSIPDPVTSALPDDSQDPTFLNITYNSTNGIILPLRLFVPQSYTPTQKYPLVIYFHSAIDPDKDNQKQLLGDNYPGTHIWTTPENQAQYPCLVMAPQCVDDNGWTNFDTEELSPMMESVLSALTIAQNEYRIDPDRIYVVGLAMGASGAWDLISKRSNLFAAAVPIVGAGDPGQIENITTLPIWAFNNTADANAGVISELVESLLEVGATPRYTEYTTTAQNISHRVFSEPDLLPWLFAQKRSH